MNGLQNNKPNATVVQCCLGSFYAIWYFVRSDIKAFEQWNRHNIVNKQAYKIMVNDLFSK